MTRNLRKQVYEKALEIELTHTGDRQITDAAWDIIRGDETADNFIEKNSNRYGLSSWGGDVLQSYHNMNRNAKMIARSYGLSF